MLFFHVLLVIYFEGDLFFLNIAFIVFIYSKMSVEILSHPGYNPIRGYDESIWTLRLTLKQPCSQDVYPLEGQRGHMVWQNLRRSNNCPLFSCITLLSQRQREKENLEQSSLSKALRHDLSSIYNCVFKTKTMHSHLLCSVRFKCEPQVDHRRPQTGRALEIGDENII